MRWRNNDVTFCNHRSELHRVKGERQLPDNVDTTRRDVCKIAYDESIRGLAQQDSVLTTYRQGAGVLATLSGLVATLIGKEVLTRVKPETFNDRVAVVLIVLGVCTFVVASLIGIFVIRPREGWKFHSSAVSIINQFAKPEAPVALDATYEQLARFNEQNFSSNSSLLGKLLVCLYWMASAIVIQIVSWIGALARLQS